MCLVYIVMEFYYYLFKKKELDFYNKCFFFCWRRVKEFIGKNKFL